MAEAKTPRFGSKAYYIGKLIEVGEDPVKLSQFKLFDLQTLANARGIVATKEEKKTLTAHMNTAKTVAISPSPSVTTSLASTEPLTNDFDNINLDDKAFDLDSFSEGGFSDTGPPIIAPPVATMSRVELSGGSAVPKHRTYKIGPYLITGTVVDVRKA